MNAVVFVVIVLTVIPVVIAQRLTRDSGVADWSLTRSSR